MNFLTGFVHELHRVDGLNMTLFTLQEDFTDIGFTFCDTHLSPRSARPSTVKVSQPVDKEVI
jgi:hypothetical protein